MKTESERMREWFVVPNSEAKNWDIVDDAAELIGSIEDKGDAKLIAKLHNIEIRRETNNSFIHDRK